MFHGSIVALVTPMNPSGELDELEFEELIERHIEAGTEAIVVSGTTGEAPTLTKEEKHKLIKRAIEIANNRIPIIAGTGTMSTAETIYESKQAMTQGAAACLIITPYCNKPTQQGLYLHYEAIAKAVPMPIILYNVPSRTSCDLLPETIERLSKITNIIGVKEATGDLKRAKEILSLCSSDFELYSGDDASALMFMLQGGKGVISVTANVAPKLMKEMCTAALKGEMQLAGEINARLMLLHKNLFIETNPIPIKWALNQLGWISEGIRLPLTPLAGKNQESVKEAMKVGGVL